MTATAAAGSAQLPDPATVVVIGTGLIGTSIAMALTGHGVDVGLQDADETSARRAADLGAGRVGRFPDPAVVAVLAVPPDAVAGALLAAQAQGLADSYTDVASIKSAVQRDVTASGAQLRCFVGGHPLAGRERSGPGAARADLFVGRPWVLTPGPETAPECLARATAVARLCGAVVSVMTPEQHDRAVGLVSHAPQVIASLLAARLAAAEEAAVALSGQGVRDTTRVAASDPALWTAILAGNAANVAPVLRSLLDDLVVLLAALEAIDEDPGAARAALRAALTRGNIGRARLPGKHGSAATPYTAVPVVVPDRPGELGRLFAAAGTAGVNVEDVTIEHSQGRPMGLVELAVRPEAADRLSGALTAAGWTVHR